MSLRSEVLGEIEQASPSVLGEGAEEIARMSVFGPVFTAGWKERLLLAGRIWRLSVGTVSGNDQVARVTGGGAGTAIDLDEPEMAIGVGTGYFLIPLEIHVSCVADMDADGELGEILVTMDRTTCISQGTTTVATMYNLLDGGPTFPGVAAHTHTGTALTNPANEEILAIETISVSDYISEGTATDKHNGVVHKLQLHYEPEIPSIAAGNCTMCVYWGGTGGASGLAYAVVACVPSTWFPVS